MATFGRGDLFSRRAFITRAASAGITLGVGLGAEALVPVAEARRNAGAFRNSLSVSPFTEAVLRQVSLTDGHGTARTVREVQQLLRRHGATEVYARIATRKHARSGDAEMGFAAGLDRARLAKELGLPFNPELGLFAQYGDASNYQQPPDFSSYPSIRLPRPWLSLDLTQMEHALRQYGRLVARQIVDTGVHVNYWDLGNEVEFGIAGVTPQPLSAGPYRAPDRIDQAIGQMSVAKLIGMPAADRISWLQAHIWPYVGRLLAATAAGIRSVDRSARFSTHISGIFEDSAALPVAFWHTVAKAGYSPQQLGTSYYPTAGAIGGSGNRFAWLKQTAATLRQRFGKPLMLAEAGYPSGMMTGAYPYNTPVTGYPLSATGQLDFIEALVRWGVRSGDLAGIRPWAPDYCVSAWEPMSFFAVSGRRARAKPGLAAIQRGLA